MDAKWKKEATEHVSELQNTGFGGGSILRICRFSKNNEHRASGVGLC